MTPIPFVDLTRDPLGLRPRLFSTIEAVMVSGRYILGENVYAFEQEFGAYFGADHAVAVANGTDAIEIGLRSLELAPGTGVIVPSMTWISTASAVLRAGLVPLFSDVDYDTAMLTPSKLEQMDLTNVGAVMVVHLYGNSADASGLRAFCDQNDLFLIEDCAQAHGAITRGGQQVGTLGDVATFSFFPTKNLGGFGDGGCCLFKSKPRADFARRFRNHGQSRKNQHHHFGINSRLDEIQAGVLRIQLSKLDEANRMRRTLGELYATMLAGVEGVEPIKYQPGAVYHLMVVRCRDRESVGNKLTALQVGHGIHYPVSLDTVDFLAAPSGRDFVAPNSRRLATEILSLPIFPGLGVEEVERVCSAVLS